MYYDNWQVLHARQNLLQKAAIAQYANSEIHLREYDICIHSFLLFIGVYCSYSTLPASACVTCRTQWYTCFNKNIRDRASRIRHSLNLPITVMINSARPPLAPILYESHTGY